MGALRLPAAQPHTVTGVTLPVSSSYTPPARYPRAARPVRSPACRRARKLAATTLPPPSG
jgi:hypothetical protein